MLEQFGKLFNFRRESLRNVDVGDFSVLMDVEKNIPSKVYINGHRCHIRYSGQQQTCFNCNKAGHHSKQCPDHRTIAPQQAGPPTAAQIVAGIQKPMSPRTIVEHNRIIRRKAPAQPTQPSAESSNIVLPASPLARRTPALGADTLVNTGPSQSLPSPPIPPNPNLDCTFKIALRRHCEEKSAAFCRIRLFHRSLLCRHHQPLTRHTCHYRALQWPLHHLRLVSPHFARFHTGKDHSRAVFCLQHCCLT